MLVPFVYLVLKSLFCNKHLISNILHQVILSLLGVQYINININSHIQMTVNTFNRTVIL